MGKKQITIPPREEVEREIEDGDWAGYFEARQKELNKGGSRQRSGTIVLTDSYPLNRTFHVGSHVELVGAFRAKHHIGSSAGFEAVEGFQGDWVLEWNKPNSRAWFSNFGAGLRQVHVQSRPGVGGVYFRGAQQSAGIDNLVVRGFGEQTIGLRAGGDTYAIRDVFSDSAKGGEGSGARYGAVAFELGEKRAVAIRMENITAHNCQTGLRWGDVAQLTVENYESELTDFPLVCTYNPRGVNLRNCAFRHTENLLRLDRVRWWFDCLIKLDGQMSDNCPGRIIHPDGEHIAPKTFDLVVEANKQGVEVTNLREMREFYRERRQSA